MVGIGREFACGGRLGVVKGFSPAIFVLCVRTEELSVVVAEERAG